MDDYELYFQNDADRMNEELFQYQKLYGVRIEEQVPSLSVNSSCENPQNILSSSSNLIDHGPGIFEVESPPTSLNSLDNNTQGTIKPASERLKKGLVILKKTQPKKIHKKDKNSKKITKPSQYPTKNFLQNFKGAHYDFLKKFFSQEKLKSYSIVEHLRGKNSVSRSTYQDLYRIPEFHHVFEKMFASKYLYRSMMLSRSELTAKKNHQKKISVLEEAFRTQVFLKIN